MFMVAIALAQFANAETGGNADCVAVVGNFCSLNDFPKLVGQHFGILSGGINEYDAELLAAKPADDIRASQGFFEDPSERTDDLVPGRMTVGVINPLEVVYVENDHAGCLLCAAIAIELAL